MSNPSNDFFLRYNDVAIFTHANDFMQTYGTTKYPESYLIDASGTLRLKFIGPRDWSDPAVVALLDAYGAQKLPNAFWHMRQWQTDASRSAPSTRNRIAPHWHPPVWISSGIVSFSFSPFACTSNGERVGERGGSNAASGCPSP